MDDELNRRDFVRLGSLGVLPLLSARATAVPTPGTTGPAAKTQAGDPSAQLAPRPEDFGALGDGMTNDTAAVQKAALASAGGLHLTAGRTYLIDRLVMPLSAGWTLEGHGATLKKRGDGDNYALLVSEKHLKNIAEAQSPVHIRNLNLEGGSVGAHCCGIVLQSWNSRLFNLNISRMTGDGIRMVGVTRSGTPLKSTLVNNWIEMINIVGCGGHGIHIDDPAGNKCTDWYIGGGWIHGCKGWGIYAKEMAGCQVGAKLHFYSNVGGGLYAGKWSIGTLIQGVYFERGQTCEIPGGWRPGMLAQCYFMGEAHLEIGFAQHGGVHKRVAVHGCNFSGESHIVHKGGADRVIEVIGCVFDTPEPFRKTGEGVFYATRCWANGQETLLDGKY